VWKNRIIRVEKVKESFTGVSEAVHPHNSVLVLPFWCQVYVFVCLLLEEESILSLFSTALDHLIINYNVQ
jgi:hypothetical protein